MGKWSNLTHFSKWVETTNYLLFNDFNIFGQVIAASQTDPQNVAEEGKSPSISPKSRLVFWYFIVLWYPFPELVQHHDVIFIWFNGAICLVDNMVPELVWHVFVNYVNYTQFAK